jgi:hypothetical protein
MKKWRLVLLFCLLNFAFSITSNAQCSICTKTAMQMGEKPAEGMNSGVIYLMLAPFAVVGYIGFRWWKTEKNHQA